MRARARAFAEKDARIHLPKSFLNSASEPSLSLCFGMSLIAKEPAGPSRATSSALRYLPLLSSAVRRSCAAMTPDGALSSCARAKTVPVLVALPPIEFGTTIPRCPVMRLD